MEMHQVRYFLAVAKELNFTHAAEACHVAQPSLSRAIQKLEAELGGQLFRRERGLTHLTELGRLMIPPLTRCFESAIAAKDLAAKFKKGGSEPLRIAISNSIDLELLQSSLSELVRVFPRLDLQLLRGSAGETAARLKDGNAEVALACPLSDSWERLDSWELFCEGFQLVAHSSHAVFKQNAITLEQLRDVRLVPRRYCEQFEALAKVLAEADVKHEELDIADSDQDLSALLSTNIGASIMPESSRLKSEQRAIKIHDLELSRPVVLYAVAGRKRTQAATSFLNLLRSANWKTMTKQQLSKTDN